MVDRTEAKQIAAYVLREIRKANYPFTSDGRLDAAKGTVGKMKFGEIRSIDELPSPNWQDVLPLAIQGYHHDMTFTATSWNVVTWTAGTIKFYDGTLQSINAGSFTLTDDAIRYIYFDLNDPDPATLKVTDSYNSMMTEYTGELCLVQRGSSAGIKATVIPSYGKQPLITPDRIDMTGLVYYTYPDGTKVPTLLSTQISAGRILISSETSFSSETFDPSKKEAQVYRSALPPTDVTKLWLDTAATPNIWKRWDGSSWVKATPSDLNEIADTLTYSRVKTTDISDGHIKLTSNTTANGTWYNSYGVIIDAVAGITIDGGKLTLRQANGGGSGQLWIDDYSQLRIDTWNVGRTKNLYPLYDYNYSLGSEAYRWTNVYAVNLLSIYTYANYVLPKTGYVLTLGGNQVAFGATVSSHIQPTTSNSYLCGSVNNYWLAVYAYAVAYKILYYFD